MQTQTETGFAVDQAPAVPKMHTANRMQADMRIAVHPAIFLHLQNA